MNQCPFGRRQKKKGEHTNLILLQQNVPRKLRIRSTTELKEDIYAWLECIRIVTIIGSDQ